MFRSLAVAVAVSLATVLVIYGAIGQGRQLRAKEALRDLPSTACAILRVDVRALRRRAATSVFLGRLLPEDQLSEIEATCGLDPIADLSEVLVWVRGSEAQPLQSVALMLEGDTVRGETLAECHKRLVEARGGSMARVEGVTGPMLASRDRRSAIALLDDRTVVTGSAQTVAEAVAAGRGLRPTLADRPSIAGLWPDLAASAAVVLVAEPPDHWKEAMERAVSAETLTSALEGVDALGLAFGFEEEHRARVVLDVATEDLAARSVERIRAWAGAPPEGIEPPWDAVLRSARVMPAGRRLQVDFDVSTLLKRP